MRKSKFWYVSVAALLCSLSMSMVVFGAQTSSDKDAVDSFCENVAGRYLYQNDDELEDRIIEFSRVDGKLYYEYQGEYDYGGAEMEIIKESSVKGTSDIEYRVMMYPFSGFAFAGDYLSEGEECTIKTCDKGVLEISGAFQFSQEDMISVKKTAKSIHASQQGMKRNTGADEIIGSWRYSSKSEGKALEVFLDFAQNGGFTAVAKCEGYPASVYLGQYSAKNSKGKITGEIMCEMLAYGGMPCEWTFTYDEKKKCPVISGDMFSVSPLANLDATDFTYKKTEAGKETGINPGPAIRLKELEGLWDEYYGYDVECEDYTEKEISSFEKEIRNYVNKEAKGSDKVELKAGEDNNSYARWFYYKDGELVFAYYFNSKEGNPDNRYYFHDGCMIEWIEGSGNDDKNRERHYSSDSPLDPRWKETQKSVLKEADKYK